MLMPSIEGDLIELADSGNYFDAIVHGCNCRVGMGAGIAKQIADRWPEIKDLDRTVRSQLGDQALGHIYYRDVKRAKGTDLTIINAYIQLDVGRGFRQVDYLALRSCFLHINNDFWKRTIAFPKIGAGLAGGDWTIIKRIIEEELLFPKINYPVFVSLPPDKT